MAGSINSGFAESQCSVHASQNILREPAEETAQAVCHSVCRARKMDNELEKIVYRLGDFPLHLATVLKEEKEFTLVANGKKKDKECILEMN